MTGIPKKIDTQCKNVLVIGNGYDIDHGLPTRYGEFMVFANKAMLNPKSISKEIEPINKLLSDNILFKHLNKIFKDKQICGDNWIDFESEISLIVKHLDINTRSLNDLVSNYFLENMKEYTLNNFQKISSFNQCCNFSKSKFTFNQFRKILFDDLQKLICALELYLVEVVEKMEAKSQSNILDGIEFDKIISFNYTHTVKNKYPKAEITYIHGECKHQSDLYDENVERNDRIERSISKNNMVIGIDEYWEDDRKNSHTNYAIFKKFVQRIQKKNDRFKENLFSFSEYNLNKGGAVSYEINVHIFGHSLDVTDKDILKRIFESSHINKIIVYCYDRPTQGEYISNIIKIIDQEKFLEYMENEKIEFVILNS